MVPGGWAPQFGYQSFGGPGLAGGLGYGVGGYGGVSPAGYPAFGFAGGGISPYGMGVSPYGMMGVGVSPYGTGMGPAFNGGVLPGVTAPMPQTVNGTGPLINAIRQTTRRSARR
jgi:hypothetical protein